MAALQDLKQFIATTVSQEVAGLHQRIDKLETRLDGFDARFDEVDRRLRDVYLVVNATQQATGEQLTDHERRIRRLEDEPGWSFHE